MIIKNNDFSILIGSVFDFIIGSIPSSVVDSAFGFIIIINLNAIIDYIALRVINLKITFFIVNKL